MKLLSLFFLLILNIIFSHSTYADLIEYPNLDIKHYPAFEHGGVRATWGMAQDYQGKMYFINTYGVLIYNGSDWTSIRLKGNQVPRAIHKDEKGNILIGFNEEFGMISFDKKGNTVYETLAKVNLSQYATPREIIKIPNTNGYFIRTPHGLYIYNNGKVSLLNNPDKFTFGNAHRIDDEIFVYVKKKGLYKLKDKKLFLVKETEKFIKSNQNIYGVLKHKDGLLLVTRKSGIFHLKNKKLVKIGFDNNLLSNTTVIKAIRLKDKGFALATYNGVFILNNDLRIIQHIDKDNGLVNDNVRSLFLDNDNNLWVGLNDGISKIKNLNGIKFFNRSYANINSIVNNVQLFNGSIYLSSSVGLKKLVTDSKSLRQKFVSVETEKLQTQTWKIIKSGEKLFVGSNKGLGFLNNENEYIDFIDKKIIGPIYVMLKSKIFENFLLVGGKKGFHLINVKDKEVIKFPEIDIDRVWEVHENLKTKEVYVRILKKGIFKIKFNNLADPKNKYSVKKYSIEHGLPNPYYDIKFFEINEETLFSTDKGIYKLLKNEDKFIKDKRFFSLKNHENKKVLSYLNLNNDQTWIAFSERINKVRSVELYKVNKKFKFKKLNVDKNILKSFSRINLEMYKDSVILSGTNGLMIIPKNFKTKNPSGKTLITSIKINNISIFNGAPHKDFLNKKLITENNFEFNRNQISFKIANTDFINEINNKYRYKLENLNDNFTNYTNSQEVTYTNLSPGKYKFNVEGINSNNQKLLPYEYSFTIKPPWWETSYFYVGEILFFILLLLIVAFSKNSKKSQKFATAMTFVVIIIIFEFLNLYLDPLVITLTGGIPVFTLASKVALGLLLQPVERLASKFLDIFSNAILGRKKIIKQDG